MPRSKLLKILSIISVVLFIIALGLVLYFMPKTPQKEIETKPVSIQLFDNGDRCYYIKAKPIVTLSCIH